MARDNSAENKKRRQYKTDWERNKYHNDPQHRERRLKKKIKNPIKPGDGDPRHGKVSSYTNHGCRCDECSDAMAQYNAERRGT